MAAKKLKSKASAEKTEQSFSIKNAPKMIMEQAEQIWLAGLGAFAKAQDQGGKIFETLIKEGQALEKATRKLTGDRVDAARGAVETTVSQVRDRASDTWDRLEQVFENRVSRALNSLGVPGPADLSELTKRVEELSRAVRALESGQRSALKSSSKATPKAAPVKPAAAVKATESKPKPVAKKPAANKTPKAATKSADSATASAPAKPRRAPRVKAKPVSDTPAA
jgi:poly(hydroxyalkanoate) granule-associated protein